MPSRYRTGSHYENHPRAAEMHDAAAHAHETAEESHEKQDHQTGQELSARSHEYSQQPHEHSEQAHTNGVNEHGFPIFGHEEIAALAYTLWQARGCPEGSPEEDWNRAAHELRARKEHHVK
jgi:DNA-binding IclR family transcriptional regulator